MSILIVVLAVGFWRCSPRCLGTSPVAAVIAGNLLADRVASRVWGAVAVAAR